METNVSTRNLLKVKIDPKGGLRADYQVTVADGGEPTIIERSENCSAEIHPDLRAAVNALREFVCKCFAFPADFLEKIEIRGVAWSGTGDGVGIVITSVLESANGLKSALNTPRIKVTQQSYGFEEDLEVAVDAVKAQVFAYLFDGKRAQLSLFGENSVEPDGEEEPDSAFN